MPGMAKFAAFLRKQFIKRREALGTTFRVIKTGKTSKGVEDLQALNDFPVLKLEYEALSAKELNPAVLDCLDPDNELQTGWQITYPFTGSEGDEANRYRVGTVQPVMLSDLEIRRFALIYTDPPG